MSPGANRLYGLLFFAALLPIAAIFVTLFIASSPSPTGGIDPTSALIAKMAATVICGALAVICVNFARQFMFTASGKTRLP
jgi:ABC-type Fe3+-siderophore transport system permease subunit